jgi:hypothetical protein
MVVAPNSGGAIFSPWVKNNSEYRKVIPTRQAPELSGILIGRLKKGYILESNTGLFLGRELLSHEGQGVILCMKKTVDVDTYLAIVIGVMRHTMQRRNE